MKDKNYNLNLPQMKISFSYNVNDEVILISGGRKPNHKYFSELLKSHDNIKIICVDHGIDFCRENNIIPEFLIGDLDSADDKSVNWAVNNKIKIERHPVDKDFTDTQLALDCINDGSFAIITGIFGGRLDHLYSNLFTCANSKIKNCLIDEREAILFLNDNENMTIEFNTKPFALSLLPISSICEGVYVDGVHWKLDSATLKQSIPNAISNRVEANRVNVSIEKGLLAIYCYFTTTA